MSSNDFSTAINRLAKDSYTEKPNARETYHGFIPRGVFNDKSWAAFDTRDNGCPVKCYDTAELEWIRYTTNDTAKAGPVHFQFLFNSHKVQVLSNLPNPTTVQTVFCYRDGTETQLNSRHWSGTIKTPMWWTNVAWMLQNMDIDDRLNRFLLNTDVISMISLCRTPPNETTPPSTRGFYMLGGALPSVMQMKIAAGYTPRNVGDGIINSLINDALRAMGGVKNVHSKMTKTPQKKLALSMKAIHIHQWLDTALQSFYAYSFLKNMRYVIMILLHRLATERPPADLHEALNVIIMANILRLLPLNYEVTREAHINAMQTGIRLARHQYAPFVGHIVRDSTTNAIVPKNFYYTASMCFSKTNVIELTITDSHLTNATVPKAARMTMTTVEHVPQVTTAPPPTAISRMYKSHPFPVMSNGMFKAGHTWVTTQIADHQMPAPAKIENIITALVERTEAPSMFMSCLDDVTGAYRAGQIYPVYFPEAHPLRDVWQALDIPAGAYPSFVLSTVIRSCIHEPGLLDVGRASKPVIPRNEDGMTLYTETLMEALNMAVTVFNDDSIPQSILGLFIGCDIWSLASTGDSFVEQLMSMVINIGHIIAQFEFKSSVKCDTNHIPLSEAAITAFVTWLLYVIYPLFCTVGAPTGSRLHNIFDKTFVASTTTPYATNTPTDASFAPRNIVVNADILEGHLRAFLMDCFYINELTCKVMLSILVPGIVVEMPHIMARHSIPQDPPSYLIYSHRIMGNMFCLENRLIGSVDHDRFYIGPVNHLLFESPLTLIQYLKTKNVNVPREFIAHNDFIDDRALVTTNARPWRNWSTLYRQFDGIVTGTLLVYNRQQKSYALLNDYVTDDADSVYNQGPAPATPHAAIADVTTPTAVPVTNAVAGNRTFPATATAAAVTVTRVTSATAPSQIDDASLRMATLPPSSIASFGTTFQATTNVTPPLVASPGGGVTGVTQALTTRTSPRSTPFPASGATTPTSPLTPTDEASNLSLLNASQSTALPTTSNAQSLPATTPLLAAPVPVPTTLPIPPPQQPMVAQAAPSPPIVPPQLPAVPQAAPQLPPVPAQPTVPPPLPTAPPTVLLPPPLPTAPPTVLLPPTLPTAPPTVSPTPLPTMQPPRLLRRLSARESNPRRFTVRPFAARPTVRPIEIDPPSIPVIARRTFSTEPRRAPITVNRVAPIINNVPQAAANTARPPIIATTTPAAIPRIPIRVFAPNNGTRDYLMRSIFTSTPYITTPLNVNYNILCTQDVPVYNLTNPIVPFNAHSRNSAALKRFLDFNKYIMEATIGDGNCLYDSLRSVLKQRDDAFSYNAIEVKNMIITHMKQNKDTVVLYLLHDKPTSWLTVVNEYIDLLAKPNEYADQIVARYAAAEVFKIDLTMFVHCAEFVNVVEKIVLSEGMTPHKSYYIILTGRHWQSLRETV